MPQYRETIADLNRKYARSFVYWKDQVVYIEKFYQPDEDGNGNSEDPIYIRLHYEKSKGDSNTLYDPENIKEIVLSPGLYNVPATHGCITSCSVSRRPLRQYRRGICQDNLLLHSFCNAVAIHAKKQPVIGFSVESWSTINALIDAKKLYMTCADLAKLDLTTSFALSVTPEFGVALNMFDSDPSKFTVFSDNNTIIGYMKDLTIYVEFEPFFQEVLDSVRNHNLSELKVIPQFIK